MGPYELLQRIVETLDRLDIPYLVTGSVAAMAYGEPRLTNDIDIVAAIEERHVAGLLAAFPPEEFCISEEIIREAIRRRLQFHIIHPSSGLKVASFQRTRRLTKAVSAVSGVSGRRNPTSQTLPPPRTSSS
jgi:hypothetical protein